MWNLFKKREKKELKVVSKNKLEYTVKIKQLGTTFYEIRVYHKKELVNPATHIRYNTYDLKNKSIKQVISTIIDECEPIIMSRDSFKLMGSEEVIEL